jgi:serine/threonine protein kinase
MNNKTKMGFIAEIDLFKTLDHPNIVKLYDIFFFS